MKHTILVLYTILHISITGISQSHLDKAKSYADSHGDTIYFPFGDISFADEVVSYDKGNPPAKEKYCNPQLSLGTPDFINSEVSGFLTLGCNGNLILKFTDNALVDIEGYDLHVFEVGSDIEPTELSISQDGKTWIKIGRISGGHASIDIAPFVKKDELFYYIQLHDLESACKKGWPGADIDAIGAMGSIPKLSIRSIVHFDFDEDILTNYARKRLDSLLNKLKLYSDYKILVLGHTDSLGSLGYNDGLSERRAHKVTDYLIKNGVVQIIKIKITTFGETKPVADNGNNIGRSRNRRVEIHISENYKYTIVDRPDK